MILPKNKKGQMIDVLMMIIFASLAGMLIFINSTHASTDVAVNNYATEDLLTISTAIAALPTDVDIIYMPSHNIGRCASFKENSLFVDTCSLQSAAVSNFNKYSPFWFPQSLKFDDSKEFMPLKTMLIQKKDNTLSFLESLTDVSADDSQIIDSAYEKKIYMVTDNSNLQDIIQSFKKILPPELFSEEKNSTNIQIILTLSEDQTSTIKYTSADEALLKPISNDIKNILIRLTKDAPTTIEVFSSSVPCEDCESNQIILQLSNDLQKSSYESYKDALGSSLGAIFIQK